MDMILKLIADVSDWIWGIPMLVILLGGSIFMTFKLGFFQFRYFPYICKQTFGKMFAKGTGEGTVSPFQAATSALASTVGASNIIGVPVAIALGGPGAVFWMWLSAFVGCAMKYSEIILGIKYREKNAEGLFVGGPMYYLKKGLKAPWLGSIFAFFLMLEIYPSIATQTVALVQNAETIGLNKYVTIVGLIILVGAVVFGGIQRISTFSEKLVPSMALLYLVAALIIVVVNITAIPEAFALIFSNAFTPTSAVGGFAGATMAAGMRWGIARGCYSNEAGMGTAPIAHSTAVTDHPARQAMWGIFEVVVSTLMICTMSAMIILTTGVWKELGSDQAAAMPSLAFQSVFGQTLGGGIITVSLLLFVLSTVIVIAFYGEKQAEFLFGPKFAKVMRVIYMTAILLGGIGGIEFLYQFLDILLALVIIPNVMGVLLLSGEVKALKDEFFTDPRYYKADIKKK